MAKNLVRNNKQPMGMELGAQNHEAKAASPNLVKSAAYEAPMKVNADRNQPNLGGEAPRAKMPGMF